MDLIMKKKRVAFVYLVHKFLKSRKRKYWVHPILSARLLKGEFATLFIDLRNDESKFFNYFRMSVKSFDELEVKLADSIRSADTVMRIAITPTEMLAVTIRYLGSGCGLIDLHYSYRIGQTTAGRIVRKVCKAIWSNLMEECIPAPSEENWLKIASHFEKYANFPNCIGAIDGKHIRCVKPALSGSLYYNYKLFYSIVLLAVADSNYRFVYIDVGSFGKDSDSAIFQNSTLFKKLQNCSLNIPERKPLPRTTSPKLPYVMVGDEAFGLSQNVLRPFGGKMLQYKKRVFNYRLSRARRFVECTFGILSNKWRIFHTALNVNLDFAIDIVKASCILHNYVRDRDGYQFEDTLSVEGFEDISEAGEEKRGGITANQCRDLYAEYFISEAGKLPWQDERI